MQELKTEPEQLFYPVKVGPRYQKLEVVVSVGCGGLSILTIVGESTPFANSLKEYKGLFFRRELEEGASTCQ